LNNAFMVRQSEHFAKLVERGAGDLASQIELACRRAWGRAPTADESADLAHYAQHHGLANVCRVILNSNEFAFID
jgi:hypothetical protein